MAKVSPALTNFNAGEWGPLTSGRVGVDKYANSLTECTNWIPTIQGPLRKRPGTQFVSHPYQVIEEEPAPPSVVPNEFVTGILIPYRRSRSINQMLQLDESGTIIIFNADGSYTGHWISPTVEFDAGFDDQRKIHTCQDKESLYIFVEDKPTLVFTYDGTTPTYDVAAFDFGPLQPENVTTTTILASGVSGNITLTASDPIFTTDMDPHGGSGYGSGANDGSGQLIAFRTIPESLHPEWGAGQGVSSGTYRWAESYETPGRTNIYKAVNNGTTGSFRPGHDEGTVSDGTVSWEMVHDAYGYARITGFTSTTEVSAKVVGNPELPADTAVTVANQTDTFTGDGSETEYDRTKIANTPISETVRIDGVVQSNPADYTSTTSKVTFTLPPASGADIQIDYQTQSSAATIRWSFGSWSDEFGYPRTGVFHQGRLICGDTATQPLTIWGSAINAPNDFYLDQASDDDAYEYTMSAEEGGRISFLESTRNLVVGSEIGIFVARATAGGPITPTDITIDRDVKFGAEIQEAVSVGNNVLFVQSGKGTCRELAYDFDSDGYVGNDLNLFAHHLGRTNFHKLAWTLEPDAIMWTYDDEGTLLAFTYEKAQNILGWHKHQLGGVSEDVAWGAVRSIASLPSADGKSDNLWMVVERFDDPITKYTIEIMSQEDVAGVDPLKQIWSDSSVIYDGPPVTTINGLDHLEGREVFVTAGAAVHPNLTVSGGSITLSYAVEKAVIGLPYDSTAATQKIEGGSQNGVSQGKQRRISNVSFRLYNARPGLTASTDGIHYTAITLRSTEDNMDEAVPLFTGETNVHPMRGNYFDGGKLYFKHTLPQACTVVAAWPQLETNDDR